MLALEQQLVLDVACGAPLLSQVFLLVAGLRACYWLPGQFDLGGLEYSDGSPVRASDFAFAVERLFRASSPGSPFYTDIVGAERFAKTGKGGIAGIQTDDETGRIAIDPQEPRGTFNNELGLLYLAMLPRGTADADRMASPPPAAGPYEITQTDPGRGWEYRRNPVWASTNSKAMPDLPSGHVDAIRIKVVSNPATQVNDIEAGRVNWMKAPLPPDSIAEIEKKYEGTQFRSEPTISNFYFWMNTQEPPFNDIRVRRAVNYAVDPRSNGSTPAPCRRPSRSCPQECPVTRNTSRTRTTSPRHGN